MKNNQWPVVDVIEATPSGCGRQIRHLIPAGLETIYQEREPRSTEDSN